MCMEHIHRIAMLTRFWLNFSGCYLHLHLIQGLIQFNSIHLFKISIGKKHTKDNVTSGFAAKLKTWNWQPLNKYTLK